MLANGYVKSGCCFPADEVEVGCCRSTDNLDWTVNLSVFWLMFIVINIAATFRNFVYFLSYCRLI